MTQLRASGQADRCFNPSQAATAVAGHAGVTHAGAMRESHAGEAGRNAGNRHCLVHLAQVLCLPLNAGIVPAFGIVAWWPAEQLGPER